MLFSYAGFRYNQIYTDFINSLISWPREDGTTKAKGLASKSNDKEFYQTGCSNSLFIYLKPEHGKAFNSAPIKIFKESFIILCLPP